MHGSRFQIPDRSPIIEHLFNSIWNSSIDGIRLIDERLTIVMVNPAYCRLAGKSEAELIGSPFSMVYGEEQGKSLCEYMRRMFETGMAHDHLESEFTLWDGSKKWLELTNVLVEPEERFIMSIVRDRTLHHQRDHALELAEKHFRLLYENAPLSYQSLDENGTILNVNPTWLRTLGYDRSEVIGRKFAEFIPEETVRSFDETFHVFKDKGEIHNVEFEMVRKDNTRIVVNYEGKIAFDESGEFKQTHCIFTDITERKRTEAELQKLNIQTRKYAHIKDELLNEVNHRVKNNLMTILGLILAEKRRTEASRASTPAAKWEEFELRIDGLLKVHQMLSDSQWGPLNLGDLVQKIVAGVLLIYETVVAVTLQVDQTEIVVSPRQANNLALVLNELTTNSLKHAFEGVEAPSIIVSEWTENDHICIEFKDNGRGYPEDVLAMNKENVGLHLVRQIVQDTLRGKVKLFNLDGAVTVMMIKMEEISRT